MRNESLFLGTLALGTLAALGISIPQARGDVGSSPTIDISEIHEGMKGYGLTVFHGTTPERFDVEVLGVQHGFRAGQSLIIIKTPHPRLDIVKTVAGMSGSPIYLGGGRLAGAYSYSLSAFEVEPVAGVTPINLMLAEMARPVPPGFWGTPLHPLVARPPRASRLASGNRGSAHASLDEPWAPGDSPSQPVVTPEATVSPYVRASTPLLLSGIGDKTTEMIRGIFAPLGLEPLQAGGGQAPITPTTPSHFVDGGGIGVQLVRGDVSMMGLGTVTHVQGTKLVAFGHPMMNGGDSAFPTCIGDVMWILASSQRSYKIGECVRPLGTLVQDRQTTIVIDETRTAPTFPVTLDVKGAEGAPKTSWHMEVAEERFLSANLTAGAIASALEATITDQRDVSWQLHSRLVIEGHPPVDLEDFGIAVGGMPEQGEIGRLRVIHALNDVLNNSWEEVGVERVESTMSLVYDRDVWRMRGVELMSDVVDAGKSVRLRVHLIPNLGHETVREIDVPIPMELAGMDAEIEVVPGYELVPDLASPENLNELLANEARQSLPPRTVVAQIKLPSQGVVFHGEVAPRLPPFAMDALRPAHSDTTAEAIPSYARTIVPVDHYVEGRDKVKVKVRRAVR